MQVRFGRFEPWRLSSGGGTPWGFDYCSSCCSRAKQQIYSKRCGRSNLAPENNYGRRESTYLTELCSPNSQDYLKLNSTSISSNHVGTVARRVHREETVVEALDDAIGQLVRRCCGIQETRPQVIIHSSHVRKWSGELRHSISTRELELTLRNSRADDLIPEESDTVLLALKRLPPKEAYDRVFRLRRAFQVCQVDICCFDWTVCQLLTCLSALLPTNCYPRISKQSPTR